MKPRISYLRKVGQYMCLVNGVGDIAFGPTMQDAYHNWTRLNPMLAEHIAWTELRKRGLFK